MQKRIRLQKLMILSLSAFISILFVILFIGRTSKTSVVLINSKKIDLTQDIMNQKNSYKIQQIPKRSLQIFGESIVTSVSELEGKRLKYPLEKDSPIPKTALTDKRSSSAFAQETPKFHTLFKIPTILSSLPPGTERGDLIDIDLLVTDADKGGPFIGSLLKNVEIKELDEATGTVFLLVTQRDFERLSLSQELGKFVVHLPGQKPIENCSPTDNSNKEKESKELEELLNSKEYNLADKKKQKELVNEIKDKYKETNNEKICYDEKDTTKTIQQDDILDEVKEGSINGSENEDDGQEEIPDITE